MHKVCAIVKLPSHPNLGVDFVFPGYKNKNKNNPNQIFPEGAVLGF